MMTRPDKWVVAVAVIGTVAGVVAAALLWLVLTAPVALATSIQGTF